MSSDDDTIGRELRQRLGEDLLGRIPKPDPPVASFADFGKHVRLPMPTKEEMEAAVGRTPLPTMEDLCERLRERITADLDADIGKFIADGPGFDALHEPWPYQKALYEGKDPEQEMVVHPDDAHKFAGLDVLISSLVEPGKAILVAPPKLEIDFAISGDGKDPYAFDQDQIAYRIRGDFLMGAAIQDPRALARPLVTVDPYGFAFQAYWVPRGELPQLYGRRWGFPGASQTWRRRREAIRAARKGAVALDPAFKG